MAAPRALPTPPSLPATPPPPSATPPRPALPTPPTALSDPAGNLGSLRKKRNFKALQLPTPPSPISAAPAGPLPPLPGVPRGLVATRNAPNQPLKRGLSIDVDNAQPHNTESSTTQRLNLQATLTTALEQMRLNSRGSGNSTTTELIQAPLQDSDLKNIAELGMGNGGSVMKVGHVPSGVVMAKKIVLIDAKPSVRKQILRELHIMHRCSSPFIVSFFGAYLSEPNICICMEYMDKGSFDSIYKTIGSKGRPNEAIAGPIPIGIVRQLAKRVLGGLVYLKDEMEVLHRDIKPSNILLNSEGEVKLCDFGVSGELENNVAKTFVGTSVYMSPERIQGSDYSVKSDVWSLGITLIELAHGCFPFADSEVEEDTPIDLTALTPISSLPSSLPSAQRHSRRKSRGVSLQGGVGTLSILELMHHIVREPPPTLITPSVPHSLEFTEEAAQFVVHCLKKDPGERMNPRDLLEMGWMDDAGRGEEMTLRMWAGTL
ncbi:kinase-like domain-containing protein [Lentinula aff. lateritia]|uniref:Kinase-like domain-containing protein n=1 Tax=Lentinula aff. lateritia TaxID=2804960 RepID=A0ACC1U837_9AGAR|nr:kinase-like domain-containing protein [Lentinula aff. lateritia]